MFCRSAMSRLCELLHIPFIGIWDSAVARHPTNLRTAYFNMLDWSTLFLKMSFAENPTTAVILLGIASAISLHAYSLLRSFQVSVDTAFQPSLSSELHRTDVWTCPRIQTLDISYHIAFWRPPAYVLTESRHHLAVGRT
jgi:hypothetical protein